MAMTSTIITPRDAILHIARLLNKEKISVKGTTVLVDEELGRVDISHSGAKLIVRMPAATTMPKMGTEIVVTGVIKKEQRRTFLLATSTLVVS